MSSKTELTFAALRAANVQRCEQSFHPLDEMNVLEWAGAMAGEAGEAANKAKKIWRVEKFGPQSAALQHGSTPSNRELGIELADTIIYADLLAASRGMTLEELIVWAFNAKSFEIGSDVFLGEPCREDYPIDSDGRVSQR